MHSFGVREMHVGSLDQFRERKRWGV
jgi:hypothetical protein